MILLQLPNRFLRYREAFEPALVVVEFNLLEPLSLHVPSFWFSNPEETREFRLRFDFASEIAYEICFDGKSNFCVYWQCYCRHCLHVPLIA